MRKIGIIGGLGAFASSRLYGLINREAVSYALLNNGGALDLIEDRDFPEIIIHQIPFASSNRFGAVEETSFREEIKDSLLALKSINVTDVVFACNTLEKLFAEVVNSIDGIEYLSTLEEVGLHIVANDTPLVILTSKEARANKLYRTGTIDRPIIEVEQHLVDDMIYASMIGYPEHASEAFENIVSMIPMDAEILFGCTELSVYSNTQKTHNTYDSLQLIAEKIVRIHHENP